MIIRRMQSSSSFKFLLILLVVVVLINILGVVAAGFYTKPDLNVTNTVTYFRVNDDLDYTISSLGMPDVFSEACRLNKTGLVPAKLYDNAEWLAFETLNNVDNLLKRVRFPLGGIKFVYGVRGSDLLASKASLALAMRNRFEKYIPKTYILDNDHDVNRLKVEFQNGKVYILKKNVQRQEGYLITNRLNTALAKRNEYVVCQEMLQNPYLINGRKINIRVYLCVIVNENKVSMSFYNNGFMYYTPRLFKRESMLPDEVITTGYIDRKVYNENPLTIRDLQEFLGETRFAVLFKNIRNMMTAVKATYSARLAHENVMLPGKKFLVYGCDIAPDSNLNVTLMEINKGPDLSYKDERDKQVKLNMVREMLNMVGLTQGSYDNFVLLE